MSIILHIAQHQQWEQAKLVQFYTGDTLVSEGFIHCSTELQVIKVANTWFPNRQGLVLLAIDSDKVEAEIRYEGFEEELFPHIYGPLNFSAVVKVFDFEPNEDGKFELPKDLINVVQKHMQKQLDLVEYVDQMALLLVPIAPEYRSGVVENFARVMAIAQLVNEFPLPTEIQTASVFEP